MQVAQARLVPPDPTGPSDVTITDDAGHVREIRKFDANGKLVERLIVRPDGWTVHQEFDADGNLERATVYDPDLRPRSLLIHRKNANGTEETAFAEFERGRDGVLRTTHTHVVVYDADGNVIERDESDIEHDETGRKTRHARYRKVTFDPDTGKPTGATTIEVHYAPNGNGTTVTTHYDADGTKIDRKIEHDENGRTSSEEEIGYDAAGKKTASTTTSYDPATGRKLRATTYTWNADGTRKTRLTITYAADGSRTEATTTYVRGPNGELKSSETVVKSFDAAGKLTGTVTLPGPGAPPP